MRPHTRTLNLISRIFMMIATVISLVARTTPAAVRAAPAQVTIAARAIAAPQSRTPSAPAVTSGIKFKLLYNSGSGLYEM